MKTGGLMKKIRELPKWTKCTVAFAMCAMIISVALLATFRNATIKQLERAEVGSNVEHLDEGVHKTTVPDGYIGIYTKEELLAITSGFTEGDYSKYNISMNNNYILMDNIDLLGENWEAIGNWDIPFKGKFDGNNYTISNLNITNNSNKMCVGMFGDTNGAHITNLKLKNENIQNNYSITWCGGLVGRAVGSEISNVKITNLTIVDNVKMEYCGGLVGLLSESGNLENTEILGSSSINNTYCKDSYVGGLVGRVDTGTIMNSYSNANIDVKSAEGNICVGGLVGKLDNDRSNHNIYIHDSYAIGNIIVTKMASGSSLNVGGLAGYVNQSLIERVYSTSNIRVEEIENVNIIAGGLIGNMLGDHLYDAYSTGLIDSEIGTLGGLIGQKNTNCYIDNTYTTSRVNGGTVAGGLIGVSYNLYNDMVTNSYWSPELTGQKTSAEGTEKSVYELLYQDTYEEWNFTTIWKIEPNGGSMAYLKDLPMPTQVLSPKIDIIATVKWEDNDTQKTKRPDSVIVKIINGNTEAGRQTIEKDVTKTQQEVTFTGLTRYDSNGEPITYTIEEEMESIFYTSSVNGTTITNKFGIPSGDENKTSITVKKVWVEENEVQKAKRPESITIKAMNGTTEAGRGTIEKDTTKAEQSVTISGLTKYDGNGNDIVYTIEEEMDSIFYTQSINQETKTITNAFQVPTDSENGQTSITVNKVWIDTEAQRAKRPESITIKVMNGSEVVGTQTIAKDTSKTEQSLTFNNLPRYDENGDEIVYTVAEEMESIFYTQSMNQETKTITNAFQVPTDPENGQTSITVQKVWIDTEAQRTKRPENITVKLMNGETVAGTQTITKDTSKTEQSVTFTGLARYDENGNTINYTITEEMESIFYTSSVNQETKTITNTFNAPTDPENGQTSITVNKVWVDTEAQRNKRPDSITIKIMNGETVAGTQTITKDTSKTEQSVTFTGLAKYDDNGNTINYTIEEEMESIFYTSSVNQETKTITNTFEVPTDEENGQIDLPVGITWDDNNNELGKRPESITIQLKQNGENYGEEVTLTSENIKVEALVVLLAEETQNEEINENTWTYTYQNLPKYDTNGNEYTYTIEETSNNKFYVSTISGNMSKYTITNTYTPSDERIEITVNKVWIEENEEQKTKRPETITIQIKNGTTIIQDYEMNSKTETSHTFTGLPKYDANNNEIEYEVAEEIESIFYKSSINQETKTITNTFEVPTDEENGQISIPIEKIWEDNGNAAGKRPESITIQLKQNGEAYGEEITLTAENAKVEEGTEGSQTDANTWVQIFESLPRYDTNGNEYNYTVEETSSNKFYVSTISGNMSKYTITNTITKPEDTVSATITKVWEDTEEQRVKRPETITIQIKNKEDGKIIQEYEMPVDKQVTEASHTFTGLPKYDNNLKEIIYTVAEEQNSINYKTSIKGNTITNTYEEVEETIQVAIQKIDKESKKGIKGAEITLKGEKEETKTTDEEGYVVFNVEKGKQYSYKETKEPEGYKINEKTYSFKVTEDGIIQDIEGNRTIENEKIKEEPDVPDKPSEPEEPSKPTNPDIPKEPDTPVLPFLPQTGENVGIILAIAYALSLCITSAIFYIKEKQK